MERDRYLKQLLDVIRVLRGSEADVAKKHLKAYETNHTLNMRKMFQLYKYIKIKQIHNYEKLKQKISPDSTDDSFNKLIRRTIDRVEESLIVDVNIRRKGAYSDVFRMKFFLRKQIMQGHILMGRGLKDRPLKVFDNVIRFGGKYELYDEVIDALGFKQTILFNADGLLEFEKIGKNIEEYEEKQYLLRKAKKLQKEYTAKGFGKSVSTKFNKELEQKVEELLVYYEQTSSANILSYYFLIKIDIERTKESRRKVHKLTKEFIELLKNSPATFSPSRIAFLQSELAKSEYNFLNFEKSLLEITHSEKWNKSRGLGFVINKILTLDNLLLMRDYSKSLAIILKLEPLPFLNKHPVQKSKINYQKSIALFGVGDYKSALNLFSEKNEIEKDKEGWNVWIRIMRILCSIEMKRLDLIDYEIESFRKYLQRVGKQYEVRERDQLILKVLMELEKQDFNFKETALQREKELKLLEATDKKTGWNPDSPEMILFHDWFKAKRLKRAYEPNYELYRKAWK